MIFHTFENKNKLICLKDFHHLSVSVFLFHRIKFQTVNLCH